MSGESDHYFPPGRSLARRVHGDRAVGLLYGQRALLIGALEPLTYTGTMLTTKAGDFPFARLAHTAKVPGDRLPRQPRGRRRGARRRPPPFRTVAASHRRARHLFPRRMRRGRNDVFFDTVTRTERRRGGTRRPDLVA